MSKERSVENTEENKVSDAVNNFYRLKSEYENKYNNFIHKIMKNTSLSNREKQKRAIAFKKKCIVCEKDGGSIFTITEENLTAVCGHTADPCALKINIKRGLYYDIEESISLYKAEVESTKEDIIKMKMNILFGYKTENEIMEAFEVLKEDFEMEFNELQEQEKSMSDIMNNSMNKIEIKRQYDEIFFIVEQMKVLMNEYDNKRDDGAVKEVVSSYISRLKPLLVKHMDTKYVVNRIEQNDDDGTYHLIQKKFEFLELFENARKTDIISNHTFKK